MLRDFYHHFFNTNKYNTGERITATIIASGILGGGVIGYVLAFKNMPERTLANTARAIVFYGPLGATYGAVAVSAVSWVPAFFYGHVYNILFPTRRRLE